MKRSSSIVAVLVIGLGLLSFAPPISAGVTNSPAAATHFSVSATATTTAGSGFTFTVTALDGSNSIDNNYLGMVHFTSSDGLATLPADTHF